MNISKKRGQLRSPASPVRHPDLRAGNLPRNTKKRLGVSIGITAYNEEKNIAKLLGAISGQVLDRIIIHEIILVASGCTDKTVQIAKIFWKEKNIPLKIIIEKERRGKASAVNQFIARAGAEICTLVSADTIPMPDCLEKLCIPFFNFDTGMTAAHPIPVNSDSTFTGFVVKTIWELHHQVALQQPKCGEMVAFRKIFDRIPAESAVDEASIEQIITSGGGRLVYVPAAIVRNKGPETIRELIAQRRRINYGHLWLIRKFKYTPATLNKKLLILLTIHLFGRNPQKNIWIIGMIFVEIWAKILAHIDYRKKKTYTIWQPISSSKNP